MDRAQSLEILDLRHFNAPALKPLLEAEAGLWMRRLHWDYRTSSRLLMQYLDSHLLPGFVSLAEGNVNGYSFCVHEDAKAVIGDVFAVTSADEAFRSTAGHAVEETLLAALIEQLQNTPHIDRIESQLLLQPAGFHAEQFARAGFERYGRLFMLQQLDGMWHEPRIELSRDLELRPWRDDDLLAASRLIRAAYDQHPDSVINDQYGTEHGSLRFLNNIVRYSGCGTFSPQASHVIAVRSSRALAGLVLSSRVSAQSGHVTQLCVHPEYRRMGLARHLLAMAAFRFLRTGATEVSLTVTEANRTAIELYQSEGYEPIHRFDATVWQRPGRSVDMLA